ncbi:LysM peptidoglycan-binding domain-containing protein [Nocardioides taihuensis]|uniref:LysM peptidoglycan-binding domain-containing protein n=1 Tax=Nocardioides taihuensis TaxID=1835606 RepID=A0ABW0BMT0_9ACTN
MHILSGHQPRAALCWVLLTAVVALATVALAPGLTGSATPRTGPVGGFEAILVRVCAVSGLASLGWLWVVATVVVVDTLRGRTGPRRGVPEGVRRLLLGACGLALAGSVASTPAHAGQPETHHPRSGVAGLPLPDRTSAVSRIAWLVDHPHRTRHPEHHAHPRPEPSPRREARVCVVSDGDTLWTLAAEHLGPSADDAAVAHAWRALYRANRAAVGPDPDLIRPGQRLRVPDHLRGGTT